MGQRAKSLVQQAKRSAGVGDPPLVTEAGGRAEGMSEAFRAFGEGDIDRFFDAFADDVQWSAPSGENFPGGGEHEGRDAIRAAFIEPANRTYASFGFRPERYLESPAENIVVAFGAFVGEPAQGAPASSTSRPSRGGSSTATRSSSSASTRTRRASRRWCRRRRRRSTKRRTRRRTTLSRESSIRPLGTDFGFRRVGVHA